jgi:hypothetical protein
VKINGPHSNTTVTKNNHTHKSLLAALLLLYWLLGAAAASVSIKNGVCRGDAFLLQEIADPSSHCARSVD